jgi:hypothetical protein
MAARKPTGAVRCAACWRLHLAGKTRVRCAPIPQLSSSTSDAPGSAGCASDGEPDGSTRHTVRGTIRPWAVARFGQWHLCCSSGQTSAHASANESFPRRPMSPVPAASFEHRDRAEGDPWNPAGAPYEQRRYDLTMALLPAARYRRALRAGLRGRGAHGAPRCSMRRRDRHGRLGLGGRPSLGALRRSRQRADCGRRGPVELAGGHVRPRGPERAGVLLHALELGALLVRSAQALASGGTLVAVHWRGRSSVICSGDRVHSVARRGRPARPASCRRDLVPGGRVDETRP